MSTLFVIRHAQASMFAANYDELSPAGIRQAARLGEVLARRNTEAGRPGFDAVFTGPAKRHHDTAAGVREAFSAEGLAFPDPTELPGFDEHDGEGLVVAALGALAKDPGGAPDWTAALAPLATQAMDATLDKAVRSRAWQRMFEAVMARWLRGQLDHLEGVETWTAFEGRVREAFAELRVRGRGEVALFTSVGPKAVILAQVLGLSPQRAFEQAWRLYNTSITRVVYSGTRMTLDGFNEVAHLPLSAWTHR